MKLIQKFIHSKGDETAYATLTLEQLWGEVYYLDRNTPSKNLSDASSGVWISLIENAVEKGKELKAQELQFRTIDQIDTSDMLEELYRIGFQKKHDRIEFRAELRELPDDFGSPLEWIQIEISDPISITKAAQIFHRAAVGDPDYNPEDDAETLLRSYLSDPVLTSGNECVQIGQSDGQSAAIVVAQVNPKSKWSRITYMGILPEFRRKGLGKWVHRHGFKMMREQGGSLYQGGTVSTNEAMLKLFHAHGCKEHRRMQEWIYKY